MADQRIAVVIEDDPDILLLLRTTLAEAGFSVHTAADGRDGVALVRAHEPVVTTLDIALPDIDGLEVARQVRSFSNTYLVMLTGRAEEIDTLLGLEAGADDYVTKPFRPRELRARIEAMLRRPRVRASRVLPTAEAAGVALAGTPAAPENRVFLHDGLVLDADARTVAVDGVPVELTWTEFELLSALLEAPRRVVTKEALARRTWEQDHSGIGPAERRAVEVHVANLRRKLGDDPATPRFIATVRGVGYRLAHRPG